MNILKLTFLRNSRGAEAAERGGGGAASVLMARSTNSIIRTIACRVDNLLDPIDAYEDCDRPERMRDIPRDATSPSSREPPEVVLYKVDERHGQGAAASATYEDAVGPSPYPASPPTRDRRDGDETSLEVFLRIRNLERYAPALCQIGAKTISDLAFLTPQDLETIGIQPEDINNLTIKFVR
ncbi:hypothetical protein JL721_4703 [Aureococcus anophagefferens]|nr:hypothetical protein JL721_4703 [Aureococcus anophagefferens]